LALGKDHISPSISLSRRSVSKGGKVSVRQVFEHPHMTDARRMEFQIFGKTLTQTSHFIPPTFPRSGCISIFRLDVAWQQMHRKEFCVSSTPAENVLPQYV
jgi:hypothetical protein